VSAPPIAVARWGRDHWGVLAYVEACAVDQKGALDRRRMRCDPALHPGLAAMDPMTSRPVDGSKYPTRLREGTASPHDDWSCLDDAEAAGLVVNAGSGVERRYALTDEGARLAAALRRHRAAGGSYSNFRPGDG